MKKFEWSISERRRLERQLRRCRDARVYKRVLAVLEYARGNSISWIARLLRISRQSVHNWIARYRAARRGVRLADARREGRPRLCGKEAEAIVRRLLRHTPDQLGYFAVNWTVPLLQEELRHQLHRNLSGDTVRRVLHRLKYRWKRSRYVLMPDPEREKKTADSSRNQSFAEAQCAAGGR